MDTFVSFFRRMTSVVLMYQFYDPKQFLTFLIFFEKLVYPLNTFPWCFGEFLGSLLSLVRIYSFLKQD